MVGIVAHGAYVPSYRLRIEDITAAAGAAGGSGEKAVASFDEDSVTMAVAAGTDCLAGVDRQSIDGLYFASTTSPYREKGASALIAAVLGLRREILTADYTDSLTAAAKALKSAESAIRSGSAHRILVLAADCRLGVPGSEAERTFGDGAAAFLLGDSAVAASIEGSYSIASEFTGLWRTDADNYVRSWEDRFVIDQGYLSAMPEAVSAVLTNHGLSSSDISRAVIGGPNARAHARLIKGLGLEAVAPSPDPLFGSVGNTGCAFAPMMLVEALERTGGGATLLYVDHGDGCEALILKTARCIAGANGRLGVEGHVRSKRPLASYHKYLRFRSIMPSDAPRRPQYGSSVSHLWRDRDQVLSLHGQRCSHCGALQFPKQRVCVNCQTRDQFDEVTLADKQAKVFTYTLDNLVPSPDPPTIMVVIDFEGGGRMICSMADADPPSVAIGMPVEMTFRRLHEGAGVHNYFWKCQPIRRRDDKK